MMNWVKKTMNRAFAGTLLLSCLFLGILLLIPSAHLLAADMTNQLVSVESDIQAEQISINIETESPVGYRYTVYDSIDPLRIVVDFPGMDISDVEAQLLPGQDVVKEVKLSSFDLT
mgnify:CR=1 FL=1